MARNGNGDAASPRKKRTTTAKMACLTVIRFGLGVRTASFVSKVSPKYEFFLT